jgi:putative membrane protein
MIEWTHWHNEPYLVGGLILMAWAYALATGPLRSRIAPDTPFPRSRAWCFYTSLLLFYLAVGSPLDQIGERFLFSAHMLQHQLLTYPSAILWVVGLPPWLVDRVAAQPGWRRIGYFATRPIAAGLAYVITQTVWHAPALYDWALQNRLVHVIEHVTFFGSAVLYWWPLLSPSQIWPPTRLPAQMMYLVAVAIGMTPLFAYLTFSPDVLYPTYEFAPRLIRNFDPAADQLLAGVMMKLGGVFMTFGALGFVFFRWYRRSEMRPAAA